MRLYVVLALVLAVLLLPQAGRTAATEVGVQTVAAGGQHTCVLTVEGGVKCWGDNTFGQLGIGSFDTDPHPSPQDVLGLTSGVAAISAGSLHTCVLTTSSGAKCWGRNSKGQLGDGSTADRASPVDVSGLTGAAGVATGASHSCAVLTSGSLKCWGRNEFGQLGDGQACGTDACTTPVEVSGLDGAALAVATGGAHTCALRSLLGPGQPLGVQCWGANYSGQVGDGGACGSACLTPVDVCSDVTCADNLTADALALGASHSCARIGSAAKCWGENVEAALGDGEACGPECATPVDVCSDATCAGSLSEVSLITAGGKHTCARTLDSSIKCWGWNTSGQLGTGNTSLQPVPVEVSELIGNTAFVAASAFHTCAETAAGDVKCWGRNDFDQLGGATRETCSTFPCSTTPLDVVGLGPDADHDGCTNQQEQGQSAALGGQRDAKSFWDFFDVPAGLPPARDRIVNVQDVGAVVARFGATQVPPPTKATAFAEAQAPPPAAPAYHAASDRGGPIPGQNLWNLMPPNGSIQVNDIGAVVTQFGHTCA